MNQSILNQSILNQLIDNNSITIDINIDTNINAAADTDMDKYNRLNAFIKSYYPILFDINFDIHSFIPRVEQQFRENGFRNFNNTDRNNFLFISNDCIGDYILRTSTIRELKLAYPDSKITLVVSPLVYNLAIANKYVDEVLIFDGSSKDLNLGPLVINLFEFCLENIWFKDGKLQHIDYAISPQWGSDNFIACLLMYMSGATHRIGYGTFPSFAWQKEIASTTIKNHANLDFTNSDFTNSDFTNSYFANLYNDNSDDYPSKNWIDNFLLTHAMITPTNLIHEVDKHLYVLSDLDIFPTNKDLEINLTETDLLDAKEMMTNDANIDPSKKKIAIGIGAGKPNAIYDANLLNEVLKNIPNAEFFIFGGVSDEDNEAKLTVPRHNYVAQLTLRQTAAMISLCDVYLGNDTGMLHMAAAFKKPIVLISREAQDKSNYIPGIMSSIARFAPWNTLYTVVQPIHSLDECSLNHVHGGCCKDFAHCINAIKPEQIVKAYHELIDKIEKN